MKTNSEIMELASGYKQDSLYVIEELSRVLTVSELKEYWETLVFECLEERRIEHSDKVIELPVKIKRASCVE